ncbi:MAG TPA: DUF1554 domain-containing protein [Leptospiraceae bacterium]|nr:DUF1554 domain-containing protein [Leptospiraceae bacterium]
MSYLLGMGNIFIKLISILWLSVFFFECNPDKKDLTLRFIQPLSTNSNSQIFLSNLTTSTGTLSPAFSQSITSYTVTVGSDITSISVTPTVNLSSVSITVNGTTVSSGVASNPISLNTGANTITIVVSQNNGLSTTYTLTVTRSPIVLTSLSGITTSFGTLSPVFSSTTTSYSMTLANAVSSFTLTPTATDSSANITVNGSSVLSGNPSSPIALSVGSNTITIVVSSGSSTTTYTINVIRLNSSVYRIFITVATYNGNLGGVTGADAKCNADVNRPNDGSTYRALVVDNSSLARRACSNPDCTNSAENLNWTFKPNTAYVRATDSAAILTTNAGGIFTFGTLTNSFGTGATVSYWTGLRNNWQSSSNDCSDWTNSTGGIDGRTGDSTATNSNAIRNNTPACNTFWYLVCVEQ